MEQATVLPYLTFRLVQEGARVIRVEHPKFGDPNRQVGEPLPDEERMNRYFLCINAGKKAITLNLGEPKGKEILARLLQDLNVDVFCTNQMPTSYQKLGIDPDTLHNIKPNLIWIGVSGFGPQNPEAAYDPILQARGGLMEMTGATGGSPQVLGIPLPDMGTSEHTYGLLMKALYKRERTGEGSTLHMSMFQSTVSWLTVPITLNGTFGEKMTRRGNTHQYFAPVSVYPTKDGFIYLAVGNDRQFEALVNIPEFKPLDKPEYKKNLGRIHDVANLNQSMAAITANLTSQDLMDKLQSIRLPVSKIQTIPEVMADPLVEPVLLKSTDPQSGLSLTLAPAPYQSEFLKKNNNTLSFPPRFGEHNAEIYGGLGYDAAALKDLQKDGII
jgi:formyl-CoA transferase